MSIRRIRRAIRTDRYELTAHSLDEMDEDDLTEEDVRDVVLRGRIERTLADDPRGVRFVICAVPRGRTQQVEVVCRFLPSGQLRIITVYCMEE
jgi:hypothetical protein